jgi:hypothetical protein
MTCTNPLTLKTKDAGKIISVPCGKCMMCRVRRTSEWTYRLILESYYWEHSSFYTLTYDDKHVPILHNETIFKDEEGRTAYWQKEGAALTLYPKDLQDFFKRLRKNTKKEFKYFCCGEYGDRDGRPHYHAILLGIRPRTDEQEIADAWGQGLVQGKPFLRQRAQYAAGYVQKKIYGGETKIIQSIRNEKGSIIDSREVKGVIPPFSRMSKGIGLKYALEQKERITKDLNITVAGHDIGLPRYFIKKLGIENESKVKSLKTKAAKAGKEKVTRNLAYGSDLIPELAEKDLKRAKILATRKESLRRIYGDNRS